MWAVNNKKQYNETNTSEDILNDQWKKPTKTNTNMFLLHFCFYCINNIEWTLKWKTMDTMNEFFFFLKHTQTSKFKVINSELLMTNPRKLYCICHWMINDTKQSKLEFSNFTAIKQLYSRAKQTISHTYSMLKVIQISCTQCINQIPHDRWSTYD